MLVDIVLETVPAILVELTAFRLDSMLWGLGFMGKRVKRVKP